MPRAGVHGFSPAVLRRQMVRAEIAPAELAELVGVSRQSVSAWLNSVTAPSPESLLKIAEVLDADVDDFLLARDGDSLSDLRVRVGLTQSAVAERLRVGRTVLGELERGERQELPAGLEGQLANLYKCEPSVVVAAFAVTRESRQRVLRAKTARRRRQ